MNTTKYNKNIQEELLNLVPDKDSLDKGLLKNFITYWWVRKSYPFLSSFELKQIKNSLSSTWINLIESNHKFRVQYGDQKAKEIIKLVEDTCLTKNSNQKEL
ncbi:MAG: hypothetical protein HYR97_05305 [Candidatus Melainabacteria bacterium]|nr:hypothetical protein [Candidatus Melainabacteria bacterium]